ncbi:hypothetical protein FNV43_RR18330 [Rhamnella rubrinervis]|uniref:SBP-type domain-containing protein n=1 Tax=Rhamnella rubrinervis TaxID=2594499 RepID=A0A8K0GSU0_9ROSA|nr:hypothetical protein FNV43_RR18330 [Rhamnella rubrinervis]
MEIGGNTLGHGIGSRGQNGNNTTTNLAWDIWELSNSSRMDWTTTPNTAFCVTPTPTTADTTTRLDDCAAHALVLSPRGYGDHGVVVHHGHLHHHQSLYAGDGSHLHPDPHLMCLKLGKRHYFEDTTTPLGERHVAGLSIGKRGKPIYSGDAGGGHPRLRRCRRRCPGARFHVVSEFDESKRSCRRRLAGHNERRRKSSHDSITRNSSHENKVIMGGRYPYISTETGRALSLLSSSKGESWEPPCNDLSTRSSAALRELIVENRAAIWARQMIILDRDDVGDPQRTTAPATTTTSAAGFIHSHQMFPEPQGWDVKVADHFHDQSSGGSHLTLDLMQAPPCSPSFGFLSARSKTKTEEDVCSDLWNSFL